MIKIDEEGLAFDDVLMVPGYSDVPSRSELLIDISTRITDYIKLKVPIITANMDTVTNRLVTVAAHQAGGLGIIHRFQDPEDQGEELLGLDSDIPMITCVGVGDGAMKRIEGVLEVLDTLAHKMRTVLVDIAHGDSKQMVDTIKQIKKEYPYMDIIAGNVCTPSGALRLVDAGACTVKVGVGPGCFAAGTRVLMANGFYRNIEDIKPGDFVINMYGKPTEVTGAQCTGKRKVIKVRHTQNAFGTVCTPDHQFLCGDLNSVSQKTLAKKGYVKTLGQLTRNKQNKVGWKEIRNFCQDVALLPKSVQFNMPKDFEVVLNHRTKEMPNLKPSYDLGYLLGFFLGDGNANCTVNKKTGSHSGCITFYPSDDQVEIVDKLDQCVHNCLPGYSFKRDKGKGCWNLRLWHKPLADFLNTFGKKDNKHLPEHLLVENTPYLMGLLQGLQDSDGIASDRTGFSNTSRQLTELWFILEYKLNGQYFPSFEKKEPTAGGLSCDIENCKPAYLSRVHPSYSVRQTPMFQVVKMLEKEELEEEVLVYDIEVKCSSHSFIADNAIVHNSMCSTRINTGFGYPQLSAISNVFDAIDRLKTPARIIADGGIRNGGDVMKAIAVGADAVMIGSLIAGAPETPGDIFLSKGGQLYKTYRGMASREAQLSWKKSFSSVEGEAIQTPLKMPVRDIIDSLKGNLLSSMTYGSGSRTLKEFRDNVRFVRQTANGLKESVPHGVR